MVELKRILSIDDPLFQSVYNLLVMSFPEQERRSWAGLEYVLTYNRHFHLNAIVRNTKFLGLFNYWLFERFCFVEHVAVMPAFRGTGIGSETFDVFKALTHVPVVLEVELPTDKLSIRRIGFYEKLGYSVVAKSYAQPPYTQDGFFVPMQLMTNDLHFVHSHFMMIKRTLYENVYGFDFVNENIIENETESELPLFC